MSFILDLARNLNPFKRKDQGAGEVPTGGVAEMAAPSSFVEPGQFRLNQPSMGNRWALGPEPEEAAGFEGFRPVGQIRQPVSPPTIEKLNQKILATKTDLEARKAQIERQLEMPLILDNLEAKRKRESEREAQLNEYLAKLAEPPPMIDPSRSASISEALAGLGASLFGVRGDKAAASTVAMGDRRRAIADTNARSQWEARQKAAGLGAEVAQSEMVRAGQGASQYEELAARIREAAMGRIFAEEDRQVARVAQLEDIQFERDWQREVMNWDKATAIEKMKLADNLQLESQKALGMFEQEVLAPLKIRNDARAEGIGLALKSLIDNRDPSQVATLARGMQEQGIVLPPGFQSLFMGIAVANRDDAAFKKTMEKYGVELQAKYFGLKVKDQELEKIRTEAALNEQGLTSDATSGSIRPLPGNLPGEVSEGEVAAYDPMGAPIVEKKGGYFEAVFPPRDLPPITGTEIGQMLDAAKRFSMAESEVEQARAEIAEYRKVVDGGGVVPERLRQAESKAIKALEDAKADHRTALAKAKGARGNQDYWNWVEMWRSRTLEIIKALSERGDSPEVVRERQAQARAEFVRVTGVDLVEVPGKRIK